MFPSSAARGEERHISIFADDYFETISLTIIIATLFVPLCASLVCGFVCRYLVRSKGYPDSLNHGFLWGFFLGFIGLVVCICKPFYTPPGDMYGGQVNTGEPCGRPFGFQPGSYDWYCSCGAANPPSSRICLFCGNTRGH